MKLGRSAAFTLIAGFVLAGCDTPTYRQVRYEGTCPEQRWPGLAQDLNRFGLERGFFFKGGVTQLKASDEGIAEGARHEVVAKWKLSAGIQKGSRRFKALVGPELTMILSSDAFEKSKASLNVMTREDFRRYGAQVTSAFLKRAERLDCFLYFTPLVVY